MGDIVEGFDKGCHTSVTLCDLSKAFDCVSHELLIAKLEFYGIRGSALDFFKSYLHERKQKVFLGEEISNEAFIQHGVPQGSVLGPLLFIFYINDIFHHVYPVSCTCYADDFSYYITDKDIGLLNNSSELT